MKYKVRCNTVRARTPSIPEHDPSILLTGSAEKFGMSGIPGYVVDIIGMSTSK